MFETDLEIEFAKKLNDVNNENHRLEIENTKLKELLKECQNMIAFNHEAYEEDALIKEIDGVLNG